MSSTDGTQCATVDDGGADTALLNQPDAVYGNLANCKTELYVNKPFDKMNE